MRGNVIAANCVHNPLHKPRALKKQDQDPEDNTGMESQYPSFYRAVDKNCEKRQTGGHDSTTNLLHQFNSFNAFRNSARFSCGIEATIPAVTAWIFGLSF